MLEATAKFSHDTLLSTSQASPRFDILPVSLLEIRFSKNGVDLGRAFTLNPQLKSATFFPSVVLKNAEMLFNFGDQPWKFPPPKVGDFF